VDLEKIGSAEKALRAQEDKLNQARIESLKGKEDADAIETLSAIKAVTTTPRDIKSTAKNFGKPPEDKAAAPADEDEDDAEEAEAEDDFEVGLEVRTADRSAAEKAELAERLEDARLAQGSPDTGVTSEVGPDGLVKPAAGGRMEGGAAGTSAVAIPIKSWDECPPGVTPAQRQTAIDDAAKLGDPSKIVIYIGHPGAKEKQDIVKASDAYKPYALTYISAYDADSIPVKLAAKGYRWDRPSRGARLQRIGVNFSTFKEQSVVKSIIVAFGPEIPCLLIPKFQKTVVEAGVGEGVNAMFEILKGLCIERNFVIDDLHIGNMAIFNGKGVTFDYDRLCEKNPEYTLFKDKLQEIHGFGGQYAGLPQFDHAFQLYNDITREPALIARYFSIYDLLSVLASLKVLCGKAGGLSAVEECELALKGDGGNTFEGRTAAVNALAAALKDVVWPEMTVVNVFNGDPPPGPGGPLHRDTKPPPPGPYGGRRTPRRRLPQLL
jgi:hypothetical protein